MKGELATLKESALEQIQREILSDTGAVLHAVLLRDYALARRCLNHLQDMNLLRDQITVLNVTGGV